MPIRNSLALVLALAVGIAGVLLGRTTVSHDAPRAEVEAPRPPSPQAAPLDDRECTVEHAELAATKAQLAHCVAGAKEPPETDTPTAADEEAEAAAVRDRKNREVLRNNTEVVIVRRADGTTNIYLPDEPIPDGIIVARRLPNGEMVRYAGPDAGPRSDPAAFSPAAPGSRLAPAATERAEDGTIMVNEEPGAPVVQ